MFNTAFKFSMYFLSDYLCRLCGCASPVGNRSDKMKCRQNTCMFVEHDGNHTLDFAPIMINTNFTSGSVVKKY